MGYKLLINGVYWGYNLFTNLLLTSWDTLVDIQGHRNWGSVFLFTPQKHIPKITEPQEGFLDV